MASISRGTTPTISLTIPNLSTLDPAQIWLTLKNGDIEITYDINTLNVDKENNTISVSLTQQDTLSYSPGFLYIQARILADNDRAFKTPMLTLTVEDILKDGIISRPTDLNYGFSELITITTQPQNYSGIIGSKYIMIVEAKGDTLSYQWQKSTNKGETWISIDNATETTYSNDLQSDDNGVLIRCFISDVHGETKISDTATLTVIS